MLRAWLACGIAACGPFYFARQAVLRAWLACGIAACGLFYFARQAVLALCCVLALQIAGCDRKQAPVPSAAPVMPAEESVIPAEAPASAREAPKQEFVARTFSSMATQIKVLLPQAGTLSAQVTLVEGVFATVEARFSEWQQGSPIARINRAAGVSAVPVADDIAWLLQRALDVGRKTEGAFDISWAALWGTWDFKGPRPVPPTRTAIEAKLRLIDHRAVIIDPVARTVMLARRGMKLGLGGIAKGYALELAAEKLRMAGVRSFLLSAGGQVLVRGGKRGEPWRIGIADPRGDGPAGSFAFVQLRDGSVATSGDYQRFFMHKSKRYHHILDPRTGMPSTGARSATVISDDATLADALATALMVLGPKKGLQVLARFPGAQAVIVGADGRLHVSAGLRDRLVIERAPRLY